MDPAEFVRANTALALAPDLPEIRLHVATDAFALWERTERELGVAVSAPPFWAFPWAGGQALARYLAEQPGTVRGRSVLDLASGSGLVAIAAARAGAATVTANEIDPHAVAAIVLNARANGVEIEVCPGDLLGGEAGAEVVLAGDVFYSREMARRVLGFLDRARSAGALVLVGDPGRAYLPRERLVQEAVYQVPVLRALEDAPVKRTVVWRLP